jgi:rubrerythrin
VEQDTTTEVADGDYVTFRAAGQQAVGEFRCSECGYGVSVHRALPRCPMCSGTAWEESTARVWH